MRIVFFVGLFFSLCQGSFLAAEPSPQMKILYTSAQIPYLYEERRSEYIRTLEGLRDFGFADQVYIAESTGGPRTFFENYSDRVFYANVQPLSFTNKGVKEGMAMLSAFDFFQFDDEDMIVKLTGRYYFKNDDFFKLLKANPQVDVFASYLESPNRVQTGCFAMRAKYFKQMLQEIDFRHMDHHRVDIERILGAFIKKMISENRNVQNVDKFQIVANIDNTHVEIW